MSSQIWKKISEFLILFLLIFVLLSWGILYYQNHYAIVPVGPKITKKYLHNHQVKLLINGVNSTRQRNQNIEDANIILLKTFEFHDDESGNALADLLIKKAKAGALIFIQFDVKGNDNYPHDFWAIKKGKKNPLPPPLQRLLKAYPHQVAIYPTNPPTTILTSFVDLLGVNIPIDHEKYLITWNTNKWQEPAKVIMGGMNISDSSLLGGEKNALGDFKIVANTQDYPWRDTDVELSGPVVQEMISRFDEEAKFQAKMPHASIQKHLHANMLQGLERLKLLIHSMNEHARTVFAPSEPVQNYGVSINYIAKNIYQNHIEQALIHYIQQVPQHETIILVTPYFLPSKELEQALIDAVSRDIQVKILTNSIHSKNKGFRQVASAGRCRMRAIFSKVDVNHLKYCEYLGHSQVGFHNLHQKVWLLGQHESSVFAIGSSNLDNQSLRINSEGMLFMQNPILQKQFQAMIENDMQVENIHELTQNDLMQESFTQRFQECGYDWLVDFVM
jgi:phosphatidylserine/phosphatidylglycerophosphate/cardiolipin synthase-like enzyme